MLRGNGNFLAEKGPLLISALHHCQAVEVGFRNDTHPHTATVWLLLKGEINFRTQADWFVPLDPAANQKQLFVNSTFLFGLQRPGEFLQRSPSHTKEQPFTLQEIGRENPDPGEYLFQVCDYRSQRPAPGFVSERVGAGTKARKFDSESQWQSEGFKCRKWDWHL